MISQLLTVLPLSMEWLFFKGFTFGYPPAGKRPQPARLRCIDRIHVSTNLIESLNKCYITFVAHFDHKAAVASLEPLDVSREGVTRKFYCPISFLADEDTAHQLTTALSNMVGRGWSGGMRR